MPPTNGSLFTFHADNTHVDECGSPPCLTNEDSHRYCGYFENQFGEQWVFEYDRQSKQGVLRGGDAGWATVCSVVDGEAPKLNLDGAERLWLRACWAAAIGQA
jgi:hypothetical protein